MIVQRSAPISQRAKASALALLSISALGLAGCGINGAQSNGATITQTMSATADGKSLSANASAGPSALGDANLAMKTLRPEAPAQLLVTGVHTGSHAGFDRVVFDLSGDGDPGWFVDYADAPTQQGSGNTINYHGDTALNVNIDGTAYPFDIGMSDPQIGTVEGTGNLVTEVVSVGTFEGRSQFVIGLNGKHPYSVTVLQDPHRLVIDVLTK